MMLKLLKNYFCEPDRTMPLSHLSFVTPGLLMDRVNHLFSKGHDLRRLVSKAETSPLSIPLGRLGVEIL